MRVYEHACNFWVCMVAAPIADRNPGIDDRETKCGPALRQKSAMFLDPRSQNHLLASLCPADFESLHPDLRAFDLISETVLVEAGDPVLRVYFPLSGIISLVVRLMNGEAVEAAMVGRDGEFGAGAALVDGQISTATAIVPRGGKALTIDVAPLRIAAEHNPSLRGRLVRFEQVIHAQALQSAACNATHTVQARLSRWLLRARDLSGSDTLTFSQEVLAEMLGRHRNSVSIVANSLQEAGLITYNRAQIEILDVEGLMKSSCECYGAVQKQTDRLLQNV